MLPARADCMLHPEESPQGIRQAKKPARDVPGGLGRDTGVFLLENPFFLFDTPGGALLMYAYGFRAIHKAFYLVEHPHAPKSILLGLPIENILNRYDIAFWVGLLSAGMFLLMLLISHFAGTEIFRNGTLLTAGLFFLPAVWLLVPTVAVRLGAIQKFQKWLWLVLRLIPISKSASEPAQFDLFVWCITNPGKAAPPEDLLEKAYADRRRLLLPGAVLAKEVKPLPELVIGAEAGSPSQHTKDISPTR